jgi:general secretion pathway protein H
MTLPPDRRRSGGFTLVEVLVVLALLAAVAAMVVPFLGRTMPHTALRATAIEVRTALAGARLQAVAEGRTIVFRGARRAGYWLDHRFRPLSTTDDPAIRLRVAAAGGGQLSFYSWGGSSGGRVRVESPAGRRDIAVDAATGHARLSP